MASYHAGVVLPRPARCRAFGLTLLAQVRAGRVGVTKREPDALCAKAYISLSGFVGFLLCLSSADFQSS